MSDKNLKDAIDLSVRSTMKTWKEAKRKSDREGRLTEHGFERLYRRRSRITLKDVFQDIIEKAYAKASTNGMYLVTARQLFYVARPMLLERCDTDKIDYFYFSQSLLKNYLESWRPKWDIVWAARGHLKEPHTRLIVDVGGAEIRGYCDSWTNGWVSSTEIQIAKKELETVGPALRFGSAMFIEKEGFAPILEAVGIGERYDMAIMSSRGIPVDALCTVASLMHAQGVKIIALRDFDKAGFTMVNTLRRGTQLALGVKETIDLGLRLSHVLEMELESEPVMERKGTTHSAREYLQRVGATKEEAWYLVEDPCLYRKGWTGKRVELNAMRSEQLINWLENRLREVGIKKVVPDTEVLSKAYKRAAYLLELDNQTSRLRDQILKELGDPPLDLDEQVRKLLARNPVLTWDQAIWAIMEKDQGGKLEDGF